jgi:hypothetical protein
VVAGKFTRGGVMGFIAPGIEDTYNRAAMALFRRKFRLTACATTGG